MGYYLLDHPNPNYAQCQRVRRNGALVSGVVDIHTSESVPDWVAPDLGAEGVARYIGTRSDPGSYHVIVDGDSTILMAPWSYECWHDRFTNNHAVGISIATQAHKWADAPAAWREAAIRRAAEAAADFARWLKATRGIDVPARWLTQAEAHARVPGFVRHGTSDPTRRSDPWPANAPEGALFLDHYRAALGATPTPPEEDDMALLPEERRRLDAIYDAIFNGGTSMPEGKPLKDLIADGGTATRADLARVEAKVDAIGAAAGVNVDALTAEVASRLTIATKEA